jgi:acyl carrier protein
MEPDNMEHADLARVVRAALEKHSRLRHVTIHDDSCLDGRVGLDSFALLEALLDVEDQLGVEVEPSRLADVREMTFTQLVALLADTRARVARAPAAGEPTP